MTVKDMLKLTWLPIVAASLCCLSPLILVLFGLSSVSFAASLSGTLYGGYRWVFRLAGLLLLGGSLWMYFRRKGICTIADARKHRTEVMNAILLVLVAGVVGYVVFLYGVVEYGGIAAGIWGAPRSAHELQPEATARGAQEVAFSAPDGYQLKGTLWTSTDPSSPAIILVHQYGSNRHDFDSFAPDLLNDGYTVLAYDIRGFGESQNGPASINDFPKDTAGAVQFLESQKTPPSHIGIIGASVGANVAFVASGSIPGIFAAVSLSPSNTGPRGVLMGSDISGFNPHSILIASDEREKSDADFIFNLAHDPKEEKTYPGFGHGVLLLRSAQARSDILAFLRAHLNP